MQMLCHKRCKGGIRGRLEGVGNKIFIIANKVKGIGIQGFSLLFQLPAAEGRYQAAVQSPGEKGTYGNVGDHLAADGILDQPGGLFYRGFIGIRMRSGGKLPVAMVFDMIRTDLKVVSRKQLFHAGKNPMSRCVCRAKHQNLTQAFLVDPGSDPVCKQCLGLGTKAQGFLLLLIKKRLYAQTVPDQIQAVLAAIIYGKGKNAV